MNGKSDIKKHKDQKEHSVERYTAKPEAKLESPDKQKEDEKEVDEEGKDKSGGFFGMFKSPKLKK